MSQQFENTEQSLENQQPQYYSQQVDNQMKQEQQMLDIKPIKNREPLISPSRILQNVNSNFQASLNQNEGSQNNNNNNGQNIFTKKFVQNRDRSRSNSQSAQKSFIKSNIQSQYVSNSQQVNNFYSNIRTNYQKENSSKKLKLTKPQSPKLHCLQRSHVKEFSAEKSRIIQQSSEKKQSRLFSSSKKGEFMLQSDLRAAQRQQQQLNNSMVSNSQQKQQLNLSHQPGVIPQYKLFQPIKKEHSPIKQKLFNLSTDKRGGQKEQKLAEKLQFEQQCQSKSRIFKAAEIPDYNEMASDGVNFGVQRKTVTQAQEPKFETDQRAQQSRSNIFFQTSQNSQNSQSNIFKARPMPNLKERTPSKPPVREKTVAIDFQLASSIRSEKRKLFDEDLKFKQEEYEKIHAQQEIQEDDQKDQEEEFQFKAHPIRQYKHVNIEKSHKELTFAEAPHFKTDDRIQSRSTQKNRNNQEQQQLFGDQE